MRVITLILGLSVAIVVAAVAAVAAVAGAHYKMEKSLFLGPSPPQIQYATVLETLFNVQECHQRIAQMIRSARFEIVFTSFCTAFTSPFLGNQSLDDLLLAAHHRGVHVNLVLNAKQGSYLSKEEVRLEEELMERRQGQYSIRLSASDDCTWFGNSYCHHHFKVLCIDRAVLLLGGGLDHSNDSWRPFEECSSGKCCWTDLAIVAQCSPSLYQTFLSGCIDAYHKDVQQQNVGLEHDVIVKHILDAQSYVYLENQFIDSSHYTYNCIARAVAHRIEQSIQACDDLRIMLITNIKESADATEAEGGCLCKWYMDSCTKRLRHTIHKLCSAGAPEDIDARLFVGSLQQANGKHITVHTQFMVVDGTILHKSSSNITDRSLSKFPCDHEFGLTFNNRPLVSSLMQKVWRHRLGVDGSAEITIDEVFFAAHSNAGQYCRITLRWFDCISVYLLYLVYKLLRVTGPCRNNRFEVVPYTSTG
jgi:phosphatidylserine/phosphatidylglycerophosphate/cardiolipin synthase-like enzyme